MTWCSISGTSLNLTFLLPNCNFLISHQNMAPFYDAQGERKWSSAHSRLWLYMDVTSTSLSGHFALRASSPNTSCFGPDSPLTQWRRVSSLFLPVGHSLTSHFVFIKLPRPVEFLTHTHTHTHMLSLSLSLSHSHEVLKRGAFLPITLRIATFRHLSLSGLRSLSAIPSGLRIWIKWTLTLRDSI